MNPYKITRLQISARSINLLQQSKKPVNGKQRETTSSSQVLPFPHQDKLDLIYQQKTSYMNLCSQLKKENELLQNTNKTHRNQSESLKEQIAGLELQYERFHKKAEEDQKLLKSMLDQERSTKQSIQSGVSEVLPEIEDMRQLLEGISTSQRQEYRALRSKYQQIEFQIGATKRLIERSRTTLNARPRTYA